MYKFESATGPSVINTETGETNIRPGVWKWREYLKWVADGGITAPPDDQTAIVRREKRAALANEVYRLLFDGVEFGGKWYNTTVEDRALLNAMGLYAIAKKSDGVNPATSLQGFSLPTADSPEGGTTIQTIIDLLSWVAENDQNIMAIARIHQAGLDASLDPGNYNISTGFPDGKKKVK